MAHHTPVSSSLRCYPLRLHPGQDLYESLIQFVKDNNLRSAFVLSCCGSVTKATIRMAEDSKEKSNEIKSYNEHFEILTLSGTLSAGEGHLHIALSDKDGKVIGGHVIGNMPIFTTAEVMIGELPEVEFKRPHDPQTGYPELEIHAIKKPRMNTKEQL